MKFPFASPAGSEFLRQLWQKSQDPFWVCECHPDDFVVTDVNPAEGAIDPRFRAGVSIRSVIGHGPVADRLLSGYFECVQTGQAVNFRQLPEIDGVERLFETLLVPIVDARGVVTHICGTSRELTSFLQAERSLQELNRELEARVAERTRELNRVNDELRNANLVLEALASTDSLTDLANRRHFFARAAEEVLRAQRYGRALSVQMLDIDHFKRLNDRFGHAAGDDVLRMVARILREGVRGNDLAARIGGEEFIVLLPETAGGDALMLADRLRHSIASSMIDIGGQRVAVTVSIGVAMLGLGENSLDTLLMRADKGLYRAKHEGRNCVRVAVEKEEDVAPLSPVSRSLA